MCLTNISTVLLGKQYNDGLFSCSPSLNCTRPETYKHKWPFGRNRKRKRQRGYRDGGDSESVTARKCKERRVIKRKMWINIEIKLSKLEQRSCLGTASCLCLLSRHCAAGGHETHNYTPNIPE